jgi:hypothetical protein
MHKDHCEGCGAVTPGYDTVSYGSIEKGYRNLCTVCFNAEVAKLNGLEDFENIRLEPIGITDSSGQMHQFHFQTRLLGGIVSLAAFELQEGSCWLSVSNCRRSRRRIVHPAGAVGPEDTSDTLSSAH